VIAVVCVTLPDVAVTITVDIPAGVAGVPAEVAQPATSPIAPTSSATIIDTRANRRRRTPTTANIAAGNKASKPPPNPAELALA